MNARIFFFILVASLMLLGVFQTVQRHVTLDIPWLPGETRTIWNIDARIDFNAKGEPVIASLTTPDAQANFTKISQNAASPGYGLSFLDDESIKKAEWTIREAKGKQTLYYNIQLLEDVKSADKEILAMPALFEKEYSDVGIAANKANIDDALKTSADAFSFTRELLKQLNADTANQNITLILTNGKDKNL